MADHFERFGPGARWEELPSIMTSVEVALILRCSEASLREKRARLAEAEDRSPGDPANIRICPVFARLGRKIRFRLEDVRAHVEANITTDLMTTAIEKRDGEPE